MPVARGVRIIGACKLVYGLLLGAAGLGIFRLINTNWGDVFEHFILLVHLDPKNHITKELLFLAGLNHMHREAFIAGTFLFAIMEIIEGAGLFLSRHWAEYLSIIATSVFLLPEGYEIAIKTDFLRLAVFMINLAIIIYLIFQLKRDRKYMLSGY